MKTHGVPQINPTDKKINRDVSRFFLSDIQATDSTCTGWAIKINTLNHQAFLGTFSKSRIRNNRQAFSECKTTWVK